MKVNVFDLQGKSVGKVELPGVFSESLRPDLIIRAFLTLQSHKRQPYGVDKEAGMRTAAHYHGKRRYRYTMMMRDMARLPRLHGTSPHLTWRARRAPHTIKGRRAHPPKPEKIWRHKINEKERKLAIRSAIAATSDKRIVAERGHRVEKIKELPLIVEDKVEGLKRTKDVKNLLMNLGLNDELRRTKTKKIRAGRGKTRGRKYRKKIGPLIVVSKAEDVVKAGKNIPGVDVRKVSNLSIEDLAPGAMPGRLTIWSKSAVAKIGDVYG